MQMLGPNELLGDKSKIYIPNLNKQLDLKYVSNFQNLIIQMKNVQNFKVLFSKN